MVDNPSNRPGCRDQRTGGATASDVVAGAAYAREDIFVHDRQIGTTTRESISDTGAQANHDSRNPALAGNGATVAFQSDASNLVPADTNAVRDVFVRGQPDELDLRSGRPDHRRRVQRDQRREPWRSG